MSEAPLEDGNALSDERLKVLFAYCHPTLVLETRVALTLGMLGGLTNDQIAGALRVPTAIVAERLAGARAKFKKAGIPFGVPRDGSLPERLADVLATVYLIFNEAYAGDGQLAAEAIRLGRMLAELLPDESEVHGLLALMLLNDGRRTSRYRHGELVLLDDEERNPWDRERVAEGEQHLARARALYGHGAYVLRAEIASVHMAEPVDWPELVALYTELARLVPSGAVELNRAIAVAEVAGPEAALGIVERIDFEPSELDHYCSLHSTRADLLRRLGRTIDARYAYGRALQLTRSEPERRFLKRRIAELPPPPLRTAKPSGTTLSTGSRLPQRPTRSRTLKHQLKTLVLNAGAFPLMRPIQPHTWNMFNRNLRSESALPMAPTTDEKKGDDDACPGT